jgi:pimeloyl-ACP methyl ester carboxylesterase
MPTVEANGLEIGFDVSGAGPPLVLLHGASSSGREDFAAQVPSFSKAFRCYLPDARGHSTTRWDATRGFRYDWLVDDLEAFVDALGLDTFHLLGFSMGAMTGLGFALRQPDRLRTMVLAGLSTQREPRTSVVRRLFDPERIERTDPAWAAELARRHDPVQGEGAWRQLLPAIARDVATQALVGPRELRGVRVPVLVACGDRDPFVPVDHAWGLKRLLPDARLLVVPDCGHEVMVKRPGLFNEAMAGFYRSTEREARRRAEAGARPLSGSRPTSGSRSVAAQSSARGDAVPAADPELRWLDEPHD